MKRAFTCRAIVVGDQWICGHCGLQWHLNDDDRPQCRPGTVEANIVRPPNYRQVGIDALKKMEGDIKYNMEKRQRDEAIMSKKEIATLEETINGLRQEYAAKAQPLQQNLKSREQEEQQKILLIVKESVEKVAEKEGYDLVLQQSAVAFSKPDLDITTKVVEQAAKTK